MDVVFCRARPTDKKYCYVSSNRSPLHVPLVMGQPIKPLMDEYQLDSVELTMDEVRGALEPPDIVGTHLNYLVMRESCVAQIRKEFSFGECEIVPAKLINSKQRVHADDYVVVNILGAAECLNTKISEMDGDADHPAVRMFGKFWLQHDRLPIGQDVFRVQGVSPGYVFSERLAVFIAYQRYTNFSFTPVKLS